MTVSLAGKTILITGASSGIGEATARACATAGMNCILTARRRKKLETLQAELGGSCKIIVGDVTEKGFNQELLHAAGDIYAVFANAGHGIAQDSLNINMKDARELFELNFFSAIELSSLVAKQFYKQNCGHILVCASCLSKFATANHGAYCASKAALEAYVKSMRMELKTTNIYISSVHPIGTKTEFFASSDMRSGKVTKSLKSPKKMPLMQPPEKVAKAIVRCLQRPIPEVWTSKTMRLASTVFSASPRLAELIVPKFLN
tara:strand:+ start:128 stop:910 length:783 start_codon:yes stop_codon:yes gene_type:complete